MRTINVLVLMMVFGATLFGFAPTADSIWAANGPGQPDGDLGPVGGLSGPGQGNNEGGPVGGN